MKRFVGDLHIHTALSPCASEEMTPPAIVQAAKQRGLAVIAICDHNTAGNVAAIQEAAGTDVAVLAGMEITSAEEVHVIGLFADVGAAQAAEADVKATLPAVCGGRPGLGDQLILDARGHVVGTESRMLGAASTFGLSDTVRLIHGHDGLAVAAHMDRPSFSVIGQLGFLPPEAEFDAVEVSAAGVAAGRHVAMGCWGLPIVASSDSHFLSELGTCWSWFEMEAPCFSELALALRGVGGRRAWCA